MQRAWTGKSCPRMPGFSLLVIPLALALLPFGGGEAWAAEKLNSCIECHGDPDFLVRATKLYDYFQEWSNSIHRQEDVSCEDCHGGNPEVSDKQGAHGTEVSGGQNPGSSVNFENIPATCGECHDAIYDGYRQSDHFDHLVEKKQDKQGPNCVTCHGSINSTVLNTNSVEKECQRCHNEETENHPDIPAEASEILNRFLSIHRYYRYIGIRGDPATTRGFFAAMDERIRELSVLWHTFDLPKIKKETRFILDLLRAKRAEIRARQRSKSP